MSPTALGYGSKFDILVSALADRSARRVMLRRIRCKYRRDGLGGLLSALMR